eukprot:2802451-Pyramimonas_sp.AAC.1
MVERGVDAKFFAIPSVEPAQGQFAVQFTGAAGPAARRATQILGAQRIAPGQCKCFEVKAAGDQRARLRIGADMDPRQVKLEIQGRKLREAFRETASDKRWVFDRDLGCIWQDKTSAPSFAQPWEHRVGHRVG